MLFWTMHDHHYSLKMTWNDLHAKPQTESQKQIHVSSQINLNNSYYTIRQMRVVSKKVAHYANWHNTRIGKSFHNGSNSMRIQHIHSRSQNANFGVKNMTRTHIGVCHNHDTCLTSMNLLIAWHEP